MSKIENHVNHRGQTVELSGARLDAYKQLLSGPIEKRQVWVSGGRNLGGPRVYSRATLDAVVRVGLAEWGSATQWYIVPVGTNEKLRSAKAARARLAEARAYVTSRFYPALPVDYAEYLMLAQSLAYEPETKIVLPITMQPIPRGAEYIIEHNHFEVTVADLLRALHCEHILDGGL